MAEAEDWVERAKARVIEVLDEQHAVVHAELESRISEAGWSGSNLNIDPHHVTSAVRELRDAGYIDWVAGRTRGGRNVNTLEPIDRRRRTTAIDRAAARKRLLFTRYLSWATSSQRNLHGLIGPAGEKAVRTAIIDSAALQPAAPGAGEVKTILGVKLNGPLDSAGYIVPVTANVPGRAVTALFEVKNIRGWIYPTSEEPYQLLSKAVQVQRERPNEPIVPILVCRRAHFTAYRMAKTLGFLIIEMQRQFVGDVDEDQMIEVRNGLHFNDLVKGSGPSLRVRDRLRGVVTNECTAFAQRWQATALGAIGDIVLAAQGAKKDTERRQIVDVLKKHVADGW